MKLDIVIFLLVKLSASVFAGDTCENWFRDSKTKPGTDCLLKCVTLMTDLNTFMCHDQCAILCKESETTGTIFTLSDLYPGLTDAERALAAKESTKALYSYKLSWEAEEICLKVFKRSIMNDGSDACRHFVWAALLYNEYGQDFSTKVLSAHEEDPNELPADRAMDLANNRLGQIVAEKLIKEKKFSKDAILKEFKNEDQLNHFVVLKKVPSNRKF